MKKTMLFFLFILFIVNVTAQKKEDVVYLKNGSVIRGIVTTDTTTEKVIILNHSGDTWVFEKSEVDSVTKEKVFEYKAYIFKKDGFEYLIESVFLTRPGENSIGKDVIPGVNFNWGYRTGYLSTTTGIGLHFYDQLQLPLFVDLRIRMSERVIAPLVFIRGGYTFPAEKKNDDMDYHFKSTGGVNFSAGFGIEKITGENSSVLLSVSYAYQELNYHLSPQWQWGTERDRTEKFNRLCFSLDLLFR